ncbi:MAG TPA: GAF and ANTAR domain-containing protein [Acidimicrobiia bacterium]|nr:GAF and ANTAR domain-containing protein [Acidimicrobiia bacterium]
MESDRLDDVRAALQKVGEGGPGSWDRVCVAGAKVPRVTGAGIILSAGGEIRTSLGKSDPVEGVIEEAQFTFGEGPCVDAARHSAPVHEPDLAGSGLSRWPIFAARAVEAGVAAVFALPLQVGSSYLGAMNFYRDRPGPLSHQQIIDVLAVAELVAHTMIALQADAPPGLLAPALADMPFRAQVHQATGMVAAQLEVGMAEALVRLRGVAYTEDRPIDEVAGRVLARTLRFDDSPD